jgi:hypothetical protein
VASVAHPTFGHTVLALFAVAGIVLAYLLIAASKLGPDQQGANIVGAAVARRMCFGHAVSTAGLR